jgi:hypothetical protein
MSSFAIRVNLSQLPDRLYTSSPHSDGSNRVISSKDEVQSKLGARNCLGGADQGPKGHGRAHGIGGPPGGGGEQPSNGLMSVHDWWGMEIVVNMKGLR